MEKLSVEEIVEEINNGATELDLEVTQHNKHILPLLIFIFRIAYNEIGAEGCKTISKALKASTSLTKLNLALMQHNKHVQFYTFNNK